MLMTQPRIAKPEKFYQLVADRFDPPKGNLPGYGLRWKKTEGIRILPAELSIWTGYSGHGKSLFLNEVSIQAGEQGEPTLLASFEMRAEKNLFRAVRQVAGRGGNIPGRQIFSCLQWLEGKLWVYDYVGTAKVKELLKEFRIAAETLGVTQFVVDSLMKLGLAEDDYNGQKHLVEELHNFAMQTHTHVHLVAHARKGDDEYRIPGKHDVLGASGITNIADNVYIVWRNKKKELEVEECRIQGKPVPPKTLQAYDALLICDKSREYGADVEKRYGFYFHSPSMQYLERREDKPNRYLTGGEELPYETMATVP